MPSSSTARDLIFTDKLSGAQSDRPELGKYLKAAREGDTLVVRQRDRLGRSMRRRITLIKYLTIHLLPLRQDVPKREEHRGHAR